MLPDFKVRVENATQSANLQALLFNNCGVRWINGSTEIKPDVRRLLCEGGGLAWFGGAEAGFLQCRAPEKTFQEVLELCRSPLARGDVPEGVREELAELRAQVQSLRELILGEVARQDRAPALDQLRHAPEETPAKKAAPHNPQPGEAWAYEPSEGGREYFIVTSPGILAQLAVGGRQALMPDLPLPLSTLATNPSCWRRMGKLHEILDAWDHE